jgi:hypothetical protein
MSTCLNDARIRAYADNEATDTERQHVDRCADCRARVEGAGRAIEDFGAMVSSLPVPVSLAKRIASTLTIGDGASQRDRDGATTLRDAPGRPWWSHLWMPAGAAAAAAVLVFLFVMPAVDAPRELSAAEVLDRSLHTMRPSSGTELVEYDLTLQVPGVVPFADEDITSLRNGTYRIAQLIDHDAGGRYRMSRYAPDGTLLGAISEDPVAGLRHVLVSVDGQLFDFEFAVDPSSFTSLRALQQQHVEMGIRVLQSIASQMVTEVDHGTQKRYVVELPQAVAPSAAGLWQLDRARLVVDGADFEILEASASGSYLGEAFGLSLRLHRRELRPASSVRPEDFDVPRDPSALRIEAAGTDDLARDILLSALRELARARRAG